MLKVIEIKETTDNSKLMDNINKTIKNIIQETEFIYELNRDDYNYINIVMQKIRTNLDIAYTIIKKKPLIVGQLEK